MCMIKDKKYYIKLTHKYNSECLRMSLAQFRFSKICEGIFSFGVTESILYPKECSSAYDLMRVLSPISFGEALRKKS